MKRLFVLVLMLCPFAMANTPGKHSVALTWTWSGTGTPTYNVYRGPATGVCSGSPTPFATGVTSTAFTDTTVAAGQTYVYAVTAVLGGESTCSAEVQVSVPTSPVAPSNLQGTTQ